MSTKRQQIVDAAQAMFEQVTVANGYRTEFGGNVHVQRTTMWGNEEAPGINIVDDDFDIEPIGPGFFDHGLLLLVFLEANAATAPEIVRDAMADVLQAVGTDPTLGGLAIDTLPSTAGGEKSNRFTTARQGNQFAAAQLSFMVTYRTPIWEI